MIRWWRRLRGQRTPPGPSVPPEHSAELAEMRARVQQAGEVSDAVARQIARRQPQVNALADFFAREKERNHLGERLDRALNGQWRGAP